MRRLPHNVSAISTKEHLTWATVLVVLTSSFGVLLSYFKMCVVTSTFGATRLYDAYVIAFTLPEMLVALLIGPLVVVFIPLYTESLIKDGEEKAWGFFSNVTNLILVFSLALSLLIIPLTPWIVRLMAPGFEKDVSGLAAGLMVIMIPIIAVMALSRMATGCLNCYHRFTIPTVGNLVNVLVATLCVIFLSPRYGIYSLAFGILLGSLGRLLVQVPAVIGRVKQYRLTFDIYQPETRKMAVLILPLIVGGCVVQIGTVVERILASGLSEGSISYLGYARTIMLMPTEVFMGAIAVVLFPVLSRCVVSGDAIGLRKTLSAGVRMGNFFLIPMCVAFYLFGGIIIQVLFERGAFVASMTEGTANALALYSISMLVWASFFMVSHVFYALKSFSLLVKTAVVVTVIGIILRIILVKYYAYAGLALASSLTVIIHTSILVVLLRGRLESLDGTRIGVSFLKVCIASGTAVIVCSLLGDVLMDAHPQPLQFMCLSLIGAGCFLIVALLLKTEELSAVVEVFKKALLRE